MSDSGQVESKADLDLPIGFGDAPTPVQLALLKTYRSDALVNAIRGELGQQTDQNRQSQSLRKSEKAGVLLRLWEFREMVNESGDESTEEMYADGSDVNGDGDTAEETSAEADEEPTDVSLADGPGEGTKARKALFALASAMREPDEWLTPGQVANRMDVSTDLTRNIPPLGTNYGKIVKSRDHPTQSGTQYRVTQAYYEEIRGKEVADQ